MKYLYLLVFVAFLGCKKSGSGSGSGSSYTVKKGSICEYKIIGPDSFYLAPPSPVKYFSISVSMYLNATESLISTPGINTPSAMKVKFTAFKDNQQLRLQGSQLCPTPITWQIIVDGKVVREAITSQNGSALLMVTE